MTWDLLFTAIVFVGLAAAGAWVRGQRTRRILASDPPPPPALAPLPVDRSRPAIAGRLYSLPDTQPPDLRAVRANAPDFDDLALVARLRESLQAALETGAEPSIPLREGARTVWAARLARAPSDALVGMPRLVSASADARWIAAELELTVLLHEGGVEREWVDRWRLRSPNEAPPRWEIASVDDLWWGPMRPQPTPGARLAPRPDGPAPDEAMVAAVARAFRGEGMSAPLSAELALRGRRGPAVPAAELGAVVLLGPEDVWVEGTSEGGRVAEHWRLRRVGAGWELWDALA